MCENRLIYALKEFNAALVTRLSFLPMFGPRSVKTWMVASERKAAECENRFEGD
jgi:hypothetical protein